MWIRFRCGWSSFQGLTFTNLCTTTKELNAELNNWDQSQVATVLNTGETGDMYTWLSISSPSSSRLRFKMKRLRQVMGQVLIYLNTFWVFEIITFLQKSTVLRTSATRLVCLKSMRECALISRLFPKFSTRKKPSFVELWTFTLKR